MSGGFELSSNQRRYVLAEGCVTSETSTGGLVTFVRSSGEYLLMNEVGADILNYLAQPHTFSELIAMVIDRYEVQEQTAIEDVSALLAECVNKHVVEVHSI